MLPWTARTLGSGALLQDLSLRSTDLKVTLRWGRRQEERWLKEPLVGTEKSMRVGGRGQQDGGGVEKKMEETRKKHNCSWGNYSD